jgi:hypothetical protein
MTPAIVSLDGPWWPYLALFLFGFLPTEIWRWMAVLFARKLDEAPLLAWVRSVATALLAGVVAKLVIFPSGALIGIPLWLRLAALAAGVIVVLWRRSWVLPAVAVGQATLIIGSMMLG